MNPLLDPADRRVPVIPGPCGLVVFGVTGDLARRKLLPALYDLSNRGLLPAGFAITGFARREQTTEDFIRQTHSAVASAARTPFRQRVWEQLAGQMRYVAGDVADPAAYGRLKEAVEQADTTQGTGGNRAFYLSLPPASFPLVCHHLAASGLATPSDPAAAAAPVTAPGGPWRRVIVEKPFGRDLASAKALDATLAQAFPPEAVFRIDHYLGKETVRNIVVCRFANQIFEPLWNSTYIDHVQITQAEDLGVGARAGYYNGIGATRDVLQNHLLQLLALVAMERPASFTAADLRLEKERVLAAVELDGPVEQATARGQYTAGWQGNLKVRGYLEEDGIPADSATDTFGALKLAVKTPRWEGTPFYLRTGKRLGRRVTEIALVARRPATGCPPGLDTPYQGANAIVFRIQPDEGMTLRIGAKVPETTMEVRDVTMDFAFGHAFTEALPDAYERLLLDVLLGNDPLFPQANEVYQAWRVIDQVESYWAASGQPPEPYPAGTWGPAGATALMARDKRVWRRP
ncbi:MAG: glucose-6-phosphate dehydrogenase [Bifidobacteriaceae bacterium]|nr:glucose-6-phosphate dehydrogenase [Bifidobacteriaceae bacterium]